MGRAKKSKTPKRLNDLDSALVVVGDDGTVVAFRGCSLVIVPHLADSGDSDSIIKAAESNKDPSDFTGMYALDVLLLGMHLDELVQYKQAPASSFSPLPVRSRLPAPDED